MTTVKDTVTIEDDDDVELVRVNTGVVDLTSDISSDEDCLPPVTVVPKPKIKLWKQSQIATPANLQSTSQPEKKIKHTIINIGAIVIPFIFRGQQQLVEKNLVEELLFFKYFRIFSDELIQCMTPVLFMITPEEKTYCADLHKQFKCTGAVSNILFVKEDVEKMLEFLKNCYDMLVLKKPKFSICGFVKILGTLIPFIMHNWFKFMPLFYFENNSELGIKLSKVGATFSNPWVLSYLKMCCKIEGVREQFYLKNQLKLVNLNSLVKHLPDGTRVDIYWPKKINDLLFRPDFLSSMKITAEKATDVIAQVTSQTKKRQRKQPNNLAKKGKSNLPTEQGFIEQASSSINDIKVTIENVMTVSEDSFDDEDSEFTESSKNQNINQNVIVIRANDKVPIQMSLNVGPVNSSQSSINIDEVLASHNQVLFNPNLHSETKSINEGNKSLSTGIQKITPGLSTTIKSEENLANKIKTEFTAATNLDQNSPIKSHTTDVYPKPTISPITTNVISGSISQQLLATSQKILNLAPPEIKSEVKSEKSIEITLDDIQGNSDNDDAIEITRPNSPTQSIVSIGSSTGDDLIDFDQAIVPVSLVTVKPIRNYTSPEMQVTVPEALKSANDEKLTTVPALTPIKIKNTLKTSVFSSPISTINNQAEPYPLLVAERAESKPVPAMRLPSITPPNVESSTPAQEANVVNLVLNPLAEAAGSTMVMPKILNSFSVEDVVEKPPPSFVRIEGSNGTTPPPVMIINKADTQSILYRVTQLEDDNIPFIDSNYLIRQIYLDGSRFNCVNLNPAKFTQWLISVSEVEIKLFDVGTTTQELIKRFFQAGLELFRLNNSQKATFGLSKDSNLTKYINGLYINFEEFKNVFLPIKMLMSDESSSFSNVASLE